MSSCLVFESNTRSKVKPAISGIDGNLRSTNHLSLGPLRVSMHACVAHGNIRLKDALDAPRDVAFFIDTVVPLSS